MTTDPNLYPAIPISGHSRREFIATLSAAAGSGLLASPVFAQSPERRLRVGIVGGGFGLSFQFHEHPNCMVEAVSDLRPERRASLKQTYRCDKAYDSLEELVKDPKIEAVALL